MQSIAACPRPGQSHEQVLGTAVEHRGGASQALDLGRCDSSDKQLEPEPLHSTARPLGRSDFAAMVAPARPVAL